MGVTDPKHKNIVIFAKTVDHDMGSDGMRPDWRLDFLA